MTEMRRCRLLCPSRLAADLGDLLGGVMRIRRAITIPAILTIGMAGASLAGTATPAAAANVSNIHVVAQGYTLLPCVYLHT